ncbi:MAG: DUF1015 domain-containing protein [Lachnospiraceae bacterium]|nr:DUF1015 domain-containing protein [Lachnospiraceae bacterium]
MADVRPFRAVVPAPGLESRTAALPYDVYNRKTARAAVEGKPLSFLNIDRPETGLPKDTDIYAPEVYERGAALFAARLQNGTFVQDAAPSYYLYELTREGKVQTGIVGLSSAADYEAGVVRRHENTRAEKEEDRVRHISALAAQTGPVFLAYRETPELAALKAGAVTGEPVFDFTCEDGVRHRGFRIDDPETVEVMRSALERVPRTYIADGHHRAASAVRLAQRRRAAGEGPEAESQAFLSVLFAQEELSILPYHRVVKGLAGMTPETFLAALQERFQVRHADAPVLPEEKYVFGMYLDGTWYELALKPEAAEALACAAAADPEALVRSLDVSVLQEEVLGPLLKIDDPRTDPRIVYVGGIFGTQELERRADRAQTGAAAFSLRPTQMEELLAVADAGLLMPPKSTWFEPKLRSGLYIHLI